MILFFLVELLTKGINKWATLKLYSDLNLTFLLYSLMNIILRYPKRRFPSFQFKIAVKVKKSF